MRIGITEIKRPAVDSKELEPVVKDIGQEKKVAAKRPKRKRVST